MHLIFPSSRMPLSPTHSAPASGWRDPGREPGPERKASAGTSLSASGTSLAAEARQRKGRVARSPAPIRHVGGGIGSVTACAEAGPWLRAGAGAGRGAQCCGLGEREERPGRRRAVRLST